MKTRSWVWGHFYFQLGMKGVLCPLKWEIKPIFNFDSERVGWSLMPDSVPGSIRDLLSPSALLRYPAERGVWLVTRAGYAIPA